MLTRPADVVAGLGLAARAVGAREAVIFLKGSFDAPAAALAAAIRDAPARRPLRDHPARRRQLRGGRGDRDPGDPRGPAALAAAQAALPRRGRAPGTPHPGAERRDPVPGAGRGRRPRRLPPDRAYARVRLGPRAHARSVRGPARHAARPHRGGRGRRRARRGRARLPRRPLHVPPRRATDSELPSTPRRCRRRARPWARRRSWSWAPPSRGATCSSPWPVSSSASPASSARPAPSARRASHRIARARASGTARARDLADAQDVAGFMSGHGYCAHCRTGAAVVGGLLAPSRRFGGMSARGPALRSLRPGIARANGDRGRPDVAHAGGGATVSTVFFLFLLHLSLGLVIALALVPDRAGEKFFKLCSAIAVFLTSTGLGLLYRRFGLDRRPERARARAPTPRCSWRRWRSPS